MNIPSIRIAHLSDLHFSRLKWETRQLFTKQTIGMFNVWLFRKTRHQAEWLWHLPELLQTLQVHALVITGDFSSTSSVEEFAISARWVAGFHKKDIATYVLPGNHDCYTQAAEKESRFYRFFPSEPLQMRRVGLHCLGGNYWYIALDCALATPLFQAYGCFFEKQQKALEEVLGSLPAEARVVVGNHFPLFPSGDVRRDLKRGDLLGALLQRCPQVILYLHGHDHTPYLIDRRKQGYPLVCNSGSCTVAEDVEKGGHLSIIDLDSQEMRIHRWKGALEAPQVFKLQND